MPPDLRATTAMALLLTLLASIAATAQAAPDTPQPEPAAAAPHFAVSPPSGGALTVIAYGDTRFTHREDVANSNARRALVDKITAENPAAIFIGGDLVYAGSDPDDYAVYASETAPWREHALPVFPALGNHEFKGCETDPDPCLANWWQAAAPQGTRPSRWYSVSVGPRILALVLDSDSALKAGSTQRLWFEQQLTHTDASVRFVLVFLHYPPVRDPLFPSARDEKEIAGYLHRHAAGLPVRVIVIGSHVHNYERYARDDVTYLVSGGGGAKPVPTLRIFGERSHLHTAINFHYLRLVLSDDLLTGTMVRYEAAGVPAQPWSEPDHFEVRARPARRARAPAP